MTSLDGLKGKQVTITGGLGFIGSNIAHECVRHGARVTILDSLDPKCGGNLANVLGIEDRIRIMRGDIRAAEDVATAVQDSDIVFNCAAYTSHAASMRDPLEYVDVNCRGLITLLEAVRRSGRPMRFVQVGTSSQVGPMLEEPVTETHPEFPADIYSATKSAGEKYAVVYGRAHGLPVMVVRLANVYGPRANIRSSAFGFINYFIGLALRNEDVTVYGEGAQLRTVTFVDDAVHALLLAAVSDHAAGQVLFAVAERQYTVRELADTIVRQMGAGRVRSMPWPKDRLAIEIGDANISSARIKSTLGWEAKTGLEDGMARTRDYYRPLLDRYMS
jgi:UDP-glucose 4-epimerase